MPVSEINLRKILWGVFAIYVLAVLYGLSFHEPWRDEAQSWLVVKNLDLAGLFKKLPSEGHPPSWYLLLFPFAKLGCPYAVQNWIAAGLMIAAVYVFLFRTPLHIAVKFLLPFSYLFFYEFPIVARSYSLMALLVAIIINLHPRRFEKPWLYAFCVVALFNTHMLMFSFCSMFVALYLWDAVTGKKLNGNTIAAAVIMSIGGLYLIPYILSSDATKVFIPFVTDHTERVIGTFSYGLLLKERGVLGIILFAVVGVAYYKNYRALALLLGGVAAIVYILAFAFPGDTRHAGLVFVVLVATSGIATYYSEATSKTDFSKYAGWIIALIILLQIKPAAEAYMDDREYNFSGSKDAAAFILEHQLENNIIVGQQAWAASALLPYLPDGKEFYYVECERFASYYTFDSCFVKRLWDMPPVYYLQHTMERFKDSLDKVTMVFNYKLPAELAPYVEPIYQTTEHVIKTDEYYYIYKFKKQ